VKEEVKAPVEEVKAEEPAEGEKKLSKK